MNLSIGCHDGDRVVVLLTFLLAAMMAIVEKVIKLPHDRHHGSQ
jgi:hypothetical protein